MGKSIRSKKKKRLRTLRRELVEEHYQKKEDTCQAVLAAAVEAPPAEILISVGKDTTGMEEEKHDKIGDIAMVENISGRSGTADDLKAKGGIKKKKKRGKMSKKLEKTLKKKAEFPV